MSKDPYRILGVGKDATADDIRKAYRKLAKASHPDLHPGDPQAAATFRELAAAHDILGDSAKRARFDRGEIDASGAERAPERPSSAPGGPGSGASSRYYYRDYADAGATGGYGTTAGFEDFEDLSDLFSAGLGRGRKGPRPGRDLRFHLTLDFLDAANGLRKRVTLPDGPVLDLTIPPGTRDGEILRLKGKGAPGLNGGEAGDGLVEISVPPHPAFQRDGDDIVIEVPITLDEAVLGGKIEVPTISGKVAMTLPPGTTSGDVLRLRGKGIHPANRPAGDQRVILKIALPPAIDGALANFLSQWRKDHPYDPRAPLMAQTTPAAHTAHAGRSKTS
ncbi:chaperone DnaJ [Rhodospirillum rubrum F11]|uniref:Chaperone DnaJ n=2 Tax=Rhodospirillum rubrum TaxID=1085 RepID=Q2RST0_RHORT|nr:DnaJ C-terminal domain-containing protein [Rhodospirillum rubrum]ABC22815.1 chaperone DnaJ [Rhodospirillum rubrum ATCC 11170]AEO48537.1 chaperone DnaJ [Rhodospirillum rubrum F11]MBK5954413.1 molecular chaperone DnaJ [Rhodospirillum rubrum]QXG78805.1 DnaJ domain-containing protein [Rhodospirillum rubrum]